MWFARPVCTRLHILNQTMRACTVQSFVRIFVWFQYHCWPADRLRINHANSTCMATQTDSATSDENKRLMATKRLGSDYQPGPCCIINYMCINLCACVCVQICVLHLYRDAKWWHSGSILLHLTTTVWYVHRRVYMCEIVTSISLKQWQVQGCVSHLPASLMLYWTQGKHTESSRKIEICPPPLSLPTQSTASCCRSSSECSDSNCSYKHTNIKTWQYPFLCFFSFEVRLLLR